VERHRKRRKEGRKEKKKKRFRYSSKGKHRQSGEKQRKVPAVSGSFSVNFGLMLRGVCIGGSWAASHISRQESSWEGVVAPVVVKMVPEKKGPISENAEPHLISSHAIKCLWVKLDQSYYRALKNSSHSPRLQLSLL